MFSNWELFVATIGGEKLEKQMTSAWIFLETSYQMNISLNYF